MAIAHTLTFTIFSNRKYCAIMMYMCNAKQTVTIKVITIHPIVIIGFFDVAMCPALAIVLCTQNVFIESPILWQFCASQARL